MNTEPTVFIVDDDASVLDSLRELVESVGLSARVFDSGDRFLHGFDPDCHGCIVCDVRMLGMSGLELQDELQARDWNTPMIFVSAHADVPMAVETVKKGAVDFLEKPYRDQDLIDSINEALRLDREQRARRAEQAAVESLVAELTPRQRDVLERLLQGKPNKTIARELELSERTVEVHRSAVLEKMQVRNQAELVARMVAVAMSQADGAPPADSLALLYEHTPLRVWIVDRAGRLEHANPAVQQLLGRPLAELRGLTLDQLFDAASGQRLQGQLLDRMARGEDAVAMPIRFHIRDVEHCSYVDVRLRRDAQGAVDGAMLLSRDTTEVHALHPRYLWHEELLALAFDHASMSIVVTDMERRIRAVNLPACRLLGYDRSALKGLILDDLLVSSTTVGGAEATQVQLRHHDGELIDARCHQTTVREPGGQPLLILNQFEDLREQIELQTQVQRQTEYLAHIDRLSALGEMAASIAHEVNQPLTAINNYVRATIRRLEHNQGARDTMIASLRKAAEQAERAGDIVQRIRQFSRRHVTDRQYLQLNDLIAELTQLLESDALSRRIEFEVRLSPYLPSVCGDPVQLNQVVMNLVRNAMDAVRDCVDERRRVQVSTELAPDACVRVVVADWGTGVAESDRASLFEPFFTTKKDGVGIGLSISKSIIEAHGGGIEYAPNEPSGSVFSFGLPPA